MAGIHDKIRAALDAQVAEKHDGFDMRGIAGYSDYRSNFDHLEGTDLEGLGDDIRDTMEGFPQVEQWEVPYFNVDHHGGGGDPVDIVIVVSWVAEGELGNATIEFGCDY